MTESSSAASNELIRLQGEVERLEAANEKLTLWCNLGGAPTPYTCTYDPKDHHVIHGGGTGDGDGMICDLHFGRKMAAQVETLTQELADAKQGIIMQVRMYRAEIEENERFRRGVEISSGIGLTCEVFNQMRLESDPATKTKIAFQDGRIADLENQVETLTRERDTYQTKAGSNLVEVKMHERTIAALQQQLADALRINSALRDALENIQRQSRYSNGEYLQKTVCKIATEALARPLPSP